jgi:hypothetical protein
MMELYFHALICFHGMLPRGYQSYLIEWKIKDREHLLERSMKHGSSWNYAVKSVIVKIGNKVCTSLIFFILKTPVSSL